MDRQTMIRWVKVTALASAALLGTVGCSGNDSRDPQADTETALGQLAIPLVTTGTSGASYRLVQATFDVSGPTSVTLTPEPDDGQVRTHLPEGRYQVTLRADWTLERDAGSGYEPVEAVLFSDNPLSVEIDPEQETQAIFRFRSGDDVVAFGDGELVITIDVVSEQFTRLPYQVADAEYSNSLNEIVVVSSAPNRLYLLNPSNDTAEAVELPATPTAVSVAPDGLHAAVGHNGQVSLVDLQSASLDQVYDVSAEVFDLVLASNGYVYIFPVVGREIHSIDLSTGEESLSGTSIRPATPAKLHPDGTKIYGLRTTVSPDDVERYNIGTEAATFAYDSPYHGTYDFCDDLWLSADGLRIFTGCGNVFRSSDSQDTDMTYNGSLGDIVVAHLTHSEALGQVLVLKKPPRIGATGKESTELDVYGYEFLGLEDTVPLPPFFVDGQSFAAEGRFVFSDISGSAYYVLVQAHADSGLLNDWAVVTLTP